jgi:hypothetical protein
MSTYNDRPDLDEELAAMTDRLMAGQDQSVSPDNAALASVVKKLYRTIGPASGSVDAGFHTRLTQRLNDEWAAAGPHKNQSQRSIAPRTVRLLSMAAATAIVLFFVMLLIGRNSGPLIGTAIDSSLGGGQGQLGPTIAAVAVLVVAVAAAAFWWFRRH